MGKCGEEGKSVPKSRLLLIPTGGPSRHNSRSCEPLGFVSLGSLLPFSSPFSMVLWSQTPCIYFWHKCRRCLTGLLPGVDQGILYLRNIITWGQTQRQTFPKSPLCWLDDASVGASADRCQVDSWGHRWQNLGDGQSKYLTQDGVHWLLESKKGLTHQGEGARGNRKVSGTTGSRALNGPASPCQVKLLADRLSPHQDMCRNIL